MAKTINQRITVTGGDEIARSLQELARLGEATFKTIADAAAKIDVNLPVDKVKQQLQDLARTGQQAFQQLGQSAQQAGQQIATVGTAGTQSVQKLSETTKDASSSVLSLSTAFKVVAGSIAGVTVAVTGLIAGWAAMAKSSSEAVLSIGRAADSAKTSIENFTRARTVLQQFGLSASDAEAIIKKLSTSTTDTLNGVKTAFEQFKGLRLAPIAEKDIPRFLESMRQMAGVTVNNRNLFDAATRAGLEFGAALNPITGQALRTTEVLTQFADRLASIQDPAKQAAIVNAFFGESLGKVLLPALQQGTAAFVDMIGKVDQLRLRTEAADRVVSQNFVNAWNLLQAVIAKNNQEIGTLIAKPLTPFVERFAVAMRRGAETFKVYEAAVKAIQPVLDDLLKLLEGRRGEIKMEWILEAEKQLKSLGEVALQVFRGVIIPAFETVKSAAEGLAGVFNRTFGTNLTGPMVAVGGAILALVGGFKALGVAILAAFAGTEQGLNPIQEALASVGINVDELKTAIVAAWDEIKAAFAGFDIGQALKDFIKAIPPLVIELTAFIALMIRFVGPANAAKFAVLSFTGVLDGLSKVAIIMSASFVTLLSALKILELAALALGVPFGAFLLVVGAIGVAILALTGNIDVLKKALALLGLDLDKVSKAIDDYNAKAFDEANKRSAEHYQKVREDIQAVVDFVKNLGTAIAQPFIDAFETVRGQFDAMVEFIKQKVAEALAALAKLNPFRRGDNLARDAGIDDIGRPEIEDRRGELPLDQPQRFAGGDQQVDFGQVRTSAEEAFAAITAAAQTTVAEVQALFQGLVDTLAASLAGLAELLAAPFLGLGATIAGALQGVDALVVSTFASIQSGVASAAAAVDAAIAQIIAALEAAIARAQDLAAAAASAAASAGSAGSESGFARGGFTGHISPHRVAGVVHGGEYVEPAHVVRRPGVRAFLETLRRVGDLREAFRRFSIGFNAGGFVDNLTDRMSAALVPGFANGGVVPQPVAVGGSRRDLGTLRIVGGGQTFEVLTDEATAVRLMRFGARSQMTSGGPTPVWARK